MIRPGAEFTGSARAGNVRRIRAVNHAQIPKPPDESENRSDPDWMEV